MENGIRFWYENRILINRFDFGRPVRSVIQLRIDLKMKIDIRFWSDKREPILRWKSILDFSGMVFDHDHDHDCNVKIGSWLRNENRGLIEKNYSAGNVFSRNLKRVVKKLNRSLRAWVDTTRQRRGYRTRFLNQGLVKIFNQGLLDEIKSMFN